MKPLNHALASERRYGGCWKDYLEIHTFFDTSKAVLASPGHRALLHNELGAALAIRIFGTTITCSDGTSVSTQLLIDDHFNEDIGFIPTLNQWLGLMPNNSLPGYSVKLPDHTAMFADNPQQAGVNAFGGGPSDYAEIVAFFDLAATYSSDPRAILFLHNSFGIWLAERTLGPAINLTMSGARSKLLATREFGERLVQARMMGIIPPAATIFSAVQPSSWSRGGAVAQTRRTRKSQLP